MIKDIDLLINARVCTYPPQRECTSPFCVCGTTCVAAEENEGRSFLIKPKAEHLAVRQLAKTIKAGDMFLNPRMNYMLLVLDSRTKTKYGLLHKWTWLFHWKGRPGLRVNDKAELRLLDEREWYEYLGNLADHKPEWL